MRQWGLRRGSGSAKYCLPSAELTQEWKALQRWQSASQSDKKL
jgi:hypothetical protein